MTRKPGQRSRWLGLHDSIPEMELGDLARLMKEHFGIAHESMEDKPYYVRFIGSPYVPFVEDCRSLGVMAHHRGTKVSPYNIKQVLTKFDITEEQFRDGYNSFFLGDTHPPEPPRPTAKPN